MSVQYQGYCSSVRCCSRHLENLLKCGFDHSFCLDKNIFTMNSTRWWENVSLLVLLSAFGEMECKKEYDKENKELWDS